MPLKGLALPVTATSAGRSAISEGDDHASKILKVALSDCDNNNAFQQDRGLRSVETVFAVSTLELRAQVRRRLLAIFRQFERDALYKLVDDSVTWSDDNDDGDLVLSFDYINLESDERETFSHRFSGQRG